MKLTFSPASPFARKVRIAAIETRADRQDRIRADRGRAGPAQREYSKITPLKKLPALILDNGDVIVDSYVIVEYLDELAGGGKLIPASGPTRWKVKSDHSLMQGMLDSMLLCRYEKMVRPQGLQWQAWTDDHWNRAWTGMARFEKQPDDAGAAVRHRRRSASSACSAMPISALPIAAGARPIRSSTPSTRRCWSGRR